MSAHSSVPRWPLTPPLPDPTGRAYVVAAPDGCAVADLWCRALSGRPVLRVPFEGLPAILGRAHVGLRLLASGPEHLVLAAAARAREEGLVDDEITLHATSADRRSVYCVHCSVTALVGGEVGGVARCPSCGRDLELFEHLSRRTGSYLGFQADAEELP